MDGAQKIEINGTLDLHHFQPKDTKPLIDEFLQACLEESIHEGRIIHGKGIGTLREIVQNHLKSHRSVKSFWNGDQTSGSWGSTGFSLKKKLVQTDDLQEA